MLKVIKSLLEKIINDIDCGNSNITEDEAMEMIKVIKSYTDKTQRLSKYQACQKLNVSRAGFAYSSYDKQFSIVVIHKASSIGEFINTFEHEKNHLEMHICEALDINPYSEEAAHMSGDLAQLILEEALYSIVEL